MPYALTIGSPTEAVIVDRNIATRTAEAEVVVAVTIVASVAEAIAAAAAFNAAATAIESNLYATHVARPEPTSITHEIARV